MIPHNAWVHGYSHNAEKTLIFERSQYGTKILVKNTVPTGSYSYTDIVNIINKGDHVELKSIVDMWGHEDAGLL